MRLDRIDTHALVARRARLRAALDGAPALLAAGRPSPRQYRANTHPFRAASHFLYLVGLHLPDAFLLVDEGATLFVEPTSDDDELWHGPTPGPDALARAVGCDVRPLAELPAHLARRAAATLPAIDADTRARQTALLGRPVAYGVLDEPSDARLADAMIGLRLRHDDAAIRALRDAADATSAAHLAGMRGTRPGDLEHAVRAAMQGALLARGMGVSYEPIVTVHGEVLHAHGHDLAMADGDLLLADVGAETHDGWAGDVTRTWPVGRRFSPTQRDAYALVLAANRAAIAKVAPGVRYRDVHLEAARVLTEGLVALGILRGDPVELVAEGAHALFFPHGVGHLLGLDVHDMEDLGDRAGYAPGRARSPQFGLSYLRLDRDLAPGMAVTIEPGFYVVPAILRDPSLMARLGDRLDRAAVARFADVRGIRLEDDVLVTETGAEVLTASIPITPDDVEALRA